MDADKLKPLVLVGTTIAGAVGGGWVAPRIGATLGLTLGPWGVAAGVVVGALAGATLGTALVGEVDFPELSKTQGRPALRSGL